MLEGLRETELDPSTDTHVLSLGCGSLGALSLPILHSAGVLCTSSGNGRPPGFSSSPEGARHLLKPGTDALGEAGLLYKAGRSPTCSSEGGFPSCRRTRRGKRLSRSAVISEGSHAVSSRKRRSPKHWGRGREAFGI